ncbi:hypothetical protein BA896_000050 [Janthinobacterium lividum]|uniref:Uncharacterized protein n=1 Tax=Janthinobacterium lividum TaxID=29581 RepID=A0A1E8PMU9_9BURK|nr:hypothetical protein BA896_000050 [Janthinobacterium lividum]
MTAFTPVAYPRQADAARTVIGLAPERLGRDAFHLPVAALEVGPVIQSHCVTDVADISVRLLRSSMCKRIDMQ